jgi:hypothetical protein
MAAKQSNKKKGGNKHSSNLRRHERKALHNRRINYTPVPGKCGSSFCEKRTGCEPWK